MKDRRRHRLSGAGNVPFIGAAVCCAAAGPGDLSDEDTMDDQPFSGEVLPYGGFVRALGLMAAVRSRP
jgi:hypothetical protein